MSIAPKVENRGGARPGAGRKPGPQSSLSAHQVARMLRKARKFAKLHGKDVDDLLLEFAYDTGARINERLAAVKLFKELTMPRISEGGDADKALGPAVFLPSQRPSLSVVDGGKKE